MYFYSINEIFAEKSIEKIFSFEKYRVPLSSLLFKTVPIIITKCKIATRRGWELNQVHAIMIMVAAKIALFNPLSHAADKIKQTNHEIKTLFSGKIDAEKILTWLDLAMAVPLQINTAHELQSLVKSTCVILGCFPGVSSFIS